MEIRKWQYYFVVNCALVYCGFAKTFSLNEVIAAELQQKQLEHTTSTISAKLEDKTSELYSENRILKPLVQKRKKIKELAKRNNLKLSESITGLSKNFSPLKYRKTFQIKSPLKPKRVKPSIRTTQKQNIQAKREISGNVNLNRKYIPLLKSLSMLLDNIIGSDSNESFEAKDKTKRIRYYSEENNEVSCKCSTRAELSSTPTTASSQEETDSVPETFSSEASTVTETPTETTDITTFGNLRSFRQNKNIPILFPRNTIGSRRDDNGLSEGGRAADNGSSQGNISGNHGNSKHNTSCGQNESCTESNEENTNSDSRYSSSSFRLRESIRRHRDNSEDSDQGNFPKEDDDASENEDENGMDITRGKFDEFKRETKLKTGRDKAKGTTILSESVGGLRGIVSKNKDGAISETIQSQETDENSIFNVTYNNTNDQRVTDRNGTLTQENKKSSERNETVTAIPILQVPTKKTRKQGPVVVIIDGYSVTRHKNGENKLSEKAIHIHS